MRASTRTRVGLSSALCVLATVVLAVLALVGLFTGEWHWFWAWFFLVEVVALVLMLLDDWL